MRKANILYADPPWQYRNEKTGGSHKSGALSKYNTMTIPQIKAYPVQAMTRNDCVCFLWATSPMIREGLDVLEAWGFEYKASLYWHKTGSLGMGFWFRNQVEVCLIGIKGKVPAFKSSMRNIIEAPRGKHSAKPNEVRELIQRATMHTFARPVRLELFAREKHRGWQAIGDQL